MWQAVVSTANRWYHGFNRAWVRPRGGARARPLPAANGVPYLPLDGVRVADGVAHTLFEEYAAHRAESRGDEETGWVLLGLREASQAVVLATLPAGAQRDASVSHVRFNSLAQAVGTQFDTAVVAAFEAILATADDSYRAGRGSSFMRERLQFQQDGENVALALDVAT